MTRGSTLRKAIEGDIVAPGCGCLPHVAPEKSVRKPVLVLLFSGILLLLPVSEDKKWHSDSGKLNTIWVGKDGISILYDPVIKNVTNKKGRTCLCKVWSSPWVESFCTQYLWSPMAALSVFQERGCCTKERRGRGWASLPWTCLDKIIMSQCYL